MNKSTVELERIKDFIFGYSHMNSFTRNLEQEKLDAVIDWSKKPENKNKKVYKHIKRRTEENVSKTKFYKPFNGEPGHTPLPYCDLVYYLDIYWQ